MIAAETIGRACLGIELDPAYVDIAIRRWQAFTGRQATRTEDGRNFAETTKARIAEAEQAKHDSEEQADARA